MKKSLVLISALCFLLCARSNANNLNGPQTPNNKVKDTTSVINKTTHDVTDNAPTISAADYRSQLMFGLKIGLNKADVYNGLTETRALPLLGWVAGGFVTIPINKLFGFQPELLYAEKGFEAIGTVAGNDYYFRRKTVYVQMPLLLQFKANKCFSLFAGPQLSLPINTKDKFDNGAITNEQREVINNGVIPQSVMGGVVGMDVYIQKVVASLRAGWDLQDINDNASSNSRRYQNSWVQVTVGYMF